MAGPAPRFQKVLKRLSLRRLVWVSPLTHGIGSHYSLQGEAKSPAQSLWRVDFSLKKQNPGMGTDRCLEEEILPHLDPTAAEWPTPSPLPRATHHPPTPLLLITPAELGMNFCAVLYLQQQIVLSVLFSANKFFS